MKCKMTIMITVDHKEFLDDVKLGDPAALLCVRGSDNWHLLLLGGQDLLRKGLHGDNNMAIIKIISITQ